jgi:phosphohistidine phosphatase
VKLFLLRHGDAEFGSPDSGRQLSALGSEQIIKTAARHREHCADVQLLLCSPLLRAVQSAGLFISGAMIECPQQTVDFLCPETAVNRVEQFLQTTDCQSILMVGHLPMLENLINYLTADTGARMETASLASLSMDLPMRGLATLDWIHYVD